MRSPQPLIVDGVRWILSAAGQEMVASKDLHLEEHISAGRAAVVKHGEHRTVYRVALPKGAVYWKHCRLNGPRAWWRDVLRGPKAKLECDRALGLAARGIGTIEPLAWGRFEQRWPAGSFLITRALEGTTPLDEYLLNNSLSPAERRAITKQLAAFVAKLHQAGVNHPDLHPGNMLVRPGDAGLEFFLIDLHDIVLGAPLTERDRLKNLVLLNRWFSMRCTRADRARFWHVYLGPGASREDAFRIEKETKRSNMRLWANRDSRCLRENRNFRRVQGTQASGFALRDLDADFAAKLGADPDAPFNQPEVVLLKDSRSATLCTLAVPTANGPRMMVYKRFRVPDWTDPFANLFRPSGALRSWLNGHALIDRGLPTPRPYLVMHRRSSLLLTVGYLLCERVPDARHLHETVASEDWQAKRKLIDTLARWVRLMHERGVSHRDLKAANILIDASGDCHFIDLVGLRLRRQVSDRIRVRDLTRLNASFVTSLQITRTDRLRFLRVYLAWGLRGSESWRTWWNQVDQGTREKVERNKRRNRPLA